MTQSSDWKENKFSKELVGKFKLRNCRVVNFSGSRYQEKGIADLRVTHTNWMGWIELKVDDNVLTNEQDRFLTSHAQRGDKALAVWYFNKDRSIKVMTYELNGDHHHATIPSIDDFVTLLLRERT